MRSMIIFLFLFCFTFPCFAATVGGPSDMELPEASLCLKNQAIQNELDMYEYNLDWKGSLETEIMTERKLKSVAPDTSEVKLEGSGVLFKLSTNISNVLEPYVKIGTSQFEIKWKQHGSNVYMEAKPGMVWGAGTKVKIWEFENIGLKLTADIQYRDSTLSVDTATLNGSAALASADNKKFEIKEMQIAVLASKKLILPLGPNDVYVVPYGGMTYSDIDVDAQFIHTGTGGLYSTYETSDRKTVGAVMGFDVMPSLSSWYLWTAELRLINETAFTLGGTIRF